MILPFGYTAYFPYLLVQEGLAGGETPLHLLMLPIYYHEESTHIFRHYQAK